MVELEVDDVVRKSNRSRNENENETPGGAAPDLGQRRRSPRPDLGLQRHGRGQKLKSSLSSSSYSGIPNLMRTEMSDAPTLLVPWHGHYCIAEYNH